MIKCCIFALHWYNKRKHCEKTQRTRVLPEILKKGMFLCIATLKILKIDLLKTRKIS